MERSRTKRFVTIAATFGFALAIGFVMQNGDVLASRLGVDTNADASDTADDYTPVSATGFIQPNIRMDAATGSVTQATDAGLGPDAASPDMTAPTLDDGAALGCDIAFDATPAHAAMVTLSFHAPCHAQTAVAVQHQGMKFHELTDTAGRFVIDVPALAKEALFVATVTETDRVVALTGVPDLDLYDRAVLQWRGDEKLALHASELGTDAQGFMTPLGNAETPAALMVQVYTFPTGLSAQDAEIAFSVHADVTPSNCGRSVIAQSIQLRPFQPPAARRITLRIPGCDSVGEILVLKNMYEDLTLAAK